jgi:hypothetical protein
MVHPHSLRRIHMLVLGIIILVIGFLVGIPILYTIGIILAIVGGVFLVVEGVGHRQIGGRRWY